MGMLFLLMSHSISMRSRHSVHFLAVQVPLILASFLCGNISTLIDYLLYLVTTKLNSVWISMSRVTAIMPRAGSLWNIRRGICRCFCNCIVSIRNITEAPALSAILSFHILSISLSTEFYF